MHTIIKIHIFKNILYIFTVNTSRKDQNTKIIIHSKFNTVGTFFLLITIHRNKKNLIV